MTAFEEYLASTYPRVESELAKIKLLTLQSAALLGRACNMTGVAQWPYVYKGVLPKEISVSTQAMCLVAINKLLGSPLAETPQVSALIPYRDAVMASVIARIEHDLADPERARAWKSNTFGPEDVFTASWLIDVLAIMSAPPATVAKRTVEIIEESLKSAIEEKFEESLFKNNEAGPHPLPLLRVFNALKTIDKTFSLRSHLSNSDLRSTDNLFLAAHWFERNLHRQMSFYRTVDFRFDAAEMIFCLAGALTTHGITPYDDVVKHVLDMVKDAQTRSVYWRPYRPMKATPQGLTLLPLSIEVASTLLQVLDDTGLFEPYQETLDKYCRWLISQRVVENPEDTRSPDNWAGWHSENAYELQDVVHVWDTARVVMFFLEYCKTVEAQVQSDLRQKSGFTIKVHSDIDKDLAGVISPDLGARNRLTQRIEEIVTRNSFSILLYGPPGVSKTTIAKAIAKQKKWHFIYITPSDFISGGESAIEHRAKLIFDGLMKVSRAVVFFDEIDRLLLDRDSKGYGEQGDIFQFMTPSMLAKLADLRKRKDLAFIIATNYAERIDRAIKREGRIDRPFLCIPPNMQARAELLRSFINDEIGRVAWVAKDKDRLKEVARSMAFYVYEELQSVVRKAVKRASSRDLSQILDALPKVVTKRPEVTIDAYKGRFQREDYPQKPVDEYLALRILEAEAGTNDEATVLAEVNALSTQYGLTSPDDLLSLAEACGLGQIIAALSRGVA